SGIDQKCILRKIHGDRTLLTLPGRGLRFSRDSARLAVATLDDVAVYQIGAGETCLTHRLPVESVEFSPDGRCLALGGFDGARLFQADTLHLLANLETDHCGPVTFHPHGRELVTFGRFSEAWRWPISPLDANSWQVGPPQRIPLVRTRFLAPQH